MTALCILLKTNKSETWLFNCTGQHSISWILNVFWNIMLCRMTVYNTACARRCGIVIQASTISYQSTQHLDPEDWYVQQFALYAKSSRPILIPEYDHILTTAQNYSPSLSYCVFLRFAHKTKRSSATSLSLIKKQCAERQSKPYTNNKRYWYITSYPANTH